jgi:predicted nucleic acid-binding protein
MMGMLVGQGEVDSLSDRLRSAIVHVPAHFDAEVLSALGRLHRAGELEPPDVERSLDFLARAPFERHLIGPLLAAAWARRSNVRHVDAIYIALAESLSAPIITLDKGVAAASPRAELLRL